MHVNVKQFSRIAWDRLLLHSILWFPTTFYQSVAIRLHALYIYCRKESGGAFYVMKYNKLVILGVMCITLASCSNKLVTTSVAYQSVRTTFTQSEKVPDKAKIAVCYDISSDGEVTAIVFNRTSEIMVIDQTRSFFVNSDGQSTSYFDPTVRTTSTTDLSSTNKGATVNLGSIGGALGIGGPLLGLLNGINVGGSSTNGQSVTKSTYIADMPQVSLAPHSNGVMSKVFPVSGLGRPSLRSRGEVTINDIPRESSDVKFSVCISYSLDNGTTFDKLVTDFYANSMIIREVRDTKTINRTLRSVYQAKPDLLYEPWWILYFPNNSDETSLNTRCQGLIYDFQ